MRDPSMSAKWTVKWSKCNESENFQVAKLMSMTKSFDFIIENVELLLEKPKSQHNTETMREREKKMKKKPPISGCSSISIVRKNAITSILSLICSNNFSAFVILCIRLWGWYNGCCLTWSSRRTSHQTFSIMMKFTIANNKILFIIYGSCILNVQRITRKHHVAICCSCLRKKNENQWALCRQTRFLCFTWLSDKWDFRLILYQHTQCILWHFLASHQVVTVKIKNTS